MGYDKMHIRQKAFAHEWAIWMSYYHTVQGLRLDKNIKYSWNLNKFRLFEELKEDIPYNNDTLGFCEKITNI